MARMMVSRPGVLCLAMLLLSLAFYCLAEDRIWGASRPPAEDGEGVIVLAFSLLRGFADIEDYLDVEAIDCTNYYRVVMSTEQTTTTNGPGRHVARILATVRVDRKQVTWAANPPLRSATNRSTPSDVGGEIDAATVSAIAFLHNRGRLSSHIAVRHFTTKNRPGSVFVIVQNYPFNTPRPAFEVEVSSDAIRLLPGM